MYTLNLRTEVQMLTIVSRPKTVSLGEADLVLTPEMQPYLKCVCVLFPAVRWGKSK